MDSAVASVLATSALVFAQAPSNPAAEAEVLAKQGDFVGAAGKFKLAYAADPKPKLICNVGVAYYKAKQLPRAQLFLTRCLERGNALDKTFVDSVRAVLTSLETTMRSGNYTPLDIVVAPETASVTIEEFGADESFIGSRTVWLPYGRHKLAAHLDGYDDQALDVETSGHEVQPVRLTLVKTPPPVEPGHDAGSGSGSATVVVPPPPEPHPLPHRVAPQPDRPSKLPAIAASSAAAVGIVLSIVGFEKAHDRADLARFAISQDVYDADQNAVTAWNAVMVSGAVIGVASAAVAGYLWSRALHSPSHVEVEAKRDGFAFGFTSRW